MAMAGFEYPNALNQRDAVAQAVKKISEQATKEVGEPLKEGSNGDTIYTVWQSKRTRNTLPDQSG